MKSWKKENEIKMTVSYTFDKYKEHDDQAAGVKEITGTMYYVNTPLAGSFLSIKSDDGEIRSISRELILSIVWHQLPKWSVMSEKQIVDSAKLRIENLNAEIAQGLEHLAQERKLREVKPAKETGMETE